MLSDDSSLLNFIDIINIVKILYDVSKLVLHFEL